jgi:hypothetical protein
MRLVYLALVGVLLVTTVSFAAQQTCDEQMIIKRCEAILPCRCICQDVRSCERGPDNKPHCASLCDCSLNCHFED